MDQPVQGQNPVLERLAFSAKNMSVWVKLMGILNIIGGALSALTIVGIIIAWAPIWMGVLLFQAGSRADEAQVAKRYDHPYDGKITPVFPYPGYNYHRFSYSGNFKFYYFWRKHVCYV